MLFMFIEKKILNKLKLKKNRLNSEIFSYFSPLSVNIYNQPF